MTSRAPRARTPATAGSCSAIRLRSTAGASPPDDVDRLRAHADDAGYLSERADGEFIAENLARDPDAKVLSIARLAVDRFGR